MNRIDKLFAEKDNLLSIYFTAGFPQLGDTTSVLESIEMGGADFVEIGMPFSDPLADGPVIQRSSLDAINNGMTMRTLFEQLTGIREKVNLPIILMGYINPVMHFGIEKFVSECVRVGVDGVILPDLPFDEYVSTYESLFEGAGLRFIPLIAPQTPDERMRHIDSLTKGFIYMVASAGITGGIKTSEEYRTKYFERVRSLGLKNQTMIGFGVKDNAGFRHACAHSTGAIIGTAFIRVLQEKGNDRQAIIDFIRSVKG